MPIEIKGMVYRNLQEQVKKNQEDIEALKNAGGADYTAGDGISIEDGVISIDDETVALKTDIPTVPTYTGGTGIDVDGTTISVDVATVATKNDLNNYIRNDDTSYTPLFRGQGVYVKGDAGAAYTTTIYGDGSISRSIPRTPGYTYTLPSTSGILALTSDIDVAETKVKIGSTTYTPTNNVVTLPLADVAMSGQYEDLINAPFDTSDAITYSYNGDRYAGLIEKGLAFYSYNSANVFDINESDAFIYAKRGVDLSELGEYADPYSSGEITFMSYEGTLPSVTSMSRLRIDPDGITYRLGTDSTIHDLSHVPCPATVPTADGTYVLKCTVSNGTVTYTWVAEV